MNSQKCLDLISRTARWCYDQTESWGHGHFGEGLAYLLWAIAARDGQPFDSTVCPEDYAELVTVLKANPNELWEELVAAGAIVQGRGLRRSKIFLSPELRLFSGISPGVRSKDSDDPVWPPFMSEVMDEIEVVFSDNRVVSVSSDCSACPTGVDPSAK